MRVVLNDQDTPRSLCWHFHWLRIWERTAREARDCNCWVASRPQNGRRSTQHASHSADHATCIKKQTAHSTHCPVHSASCTLHSTHHTSHSTQCLSQQCKSHITRYTAHSAHHSSAHPSKASTQVGLHRIRHTLPAFNIPPQYMQAGPFSPTCVDTSNVIWGVVFSSWPQQQTGNVQCRRLILGGLYVRLHACTTPFDLNWQCRTKVHKCKNTNKYKNKGPADAYLWENSEDPFHIWHFSVPLFC